MIGVFDSGVGGLSVLKEIRRKLPHASLTYVADSAFVPYGPKPPEIIRDRALAIGAWLHDHDARLVVIACNTATAVAAEHLRNHLPCPVVAMEPAVKPAAAITQTGIIGVLATSGTLQSARFAGLLDKFGKHLTVLTEPAPDLVALVEAGEIDSAKAREALQGHISPLIAAGADVIVLGCTHFPFLRPILAELLPTGVGIIDTGEAVARQVLRFYEPSSSVEVGNENRQHSPQPTARFLTTAAGHETGAVVSKLWGADVIPELLELPCSGQV